MDGGKRAHTGAQNDEGGKIRGLLALGQEQSTKAFGYQLSAFGQSLKFCAIGEVGRYRFADS